MGVAVAFFHFGHIGCMDDVRSLVLIPLKYGPFEAETSFFAGLRLPQGICGPEVHHKTRLVSPDLFGGAWIPQTLRHFFFFTVHEQ
jgi:hypothetical protein